MVTYFFRKRKSVVYSWMLSYILIILIPVATTSLVYFISKNIIEDEVKKSNEKTIVKIRDNMDSLLNDFNRFSIEVAKNQALQNVFTLNKSSADYNYRLLKAAKDMNTYKIFNSAYIRFYIYINNLNTVIGQGIVYDQETYYRLYVSSIESNMEKWLEAMNMKHYGECMFLPYIGYQKTDAEAAAFVWSIPYDVIGNFSANLVLLFDLEEFVSGKENELYNNDRNLYVLNKNGALVAGNSLNDIQFDFIYSKIDKYQGNLVENVNGKKTVITYTTSKINGWKYITLTPQEVFWNRVQFIRNLMIGGLILCIFLGGFISYFFVKKNYNPLKETINYFKEKFHSEHNWENDEYGFIRNALGETINLKEEIQTKLEEQNRILKSYFIVNLLKGKELFAPFDELLTTYDINFRYDNFTVMAIYIEHLDETFWNKHLEKGVNKFEIAKYSISNVLDKLVNRDNYGYIVEVDDILVCLVNLNAGSETYKHELIKLVDEAKGFLEKNYCIKITTAIGALHNGWEGIPDAFTEAMQTLEYSRVIGTCNTSFYNEISWDTGSYYYPAEKEYKLINCIKSGDLIEACNILEDIFNKNFNSATPSIDIAKCLMMDLVGTVLKATNKNNKKDNNDFDEKFIPVREIIECCTLLEMKKKIFEIVENICEYTSTDNCHTNFQ
ncbi:MAG TPA: cache domain-containing protein, partial [Clostridiales bacterium]|nr:cache domain-containing protein [Clostridiales bacterium]